MHPNPRDRLKCFRQAAHSFVRPAFPTPLHSSAKGVPSIVIQSCTTSRQTLCNFQMATLFSRWGPFFLRVFSGTRHCGCYMSRVTQRKNCRIRGAISSSSCEKTVRHDCCETPSPPTKYSEPSTRHV